MLMDALASKTAVAADTKEDLDKFGTRRNRSHVVKPSLANVKEAEIMFELAHEPGTVMGRDGILFGVTTCEYDVAQGTSGAANTFMYHCKDGQKHVNGCEPHALHATCSSTGCTKTVANCNIIILKFSRAAAQDNSEARGTLTVYDIDNDGQRRQCGPGPLAVGLPDDKEFFFCCDTCAPGQGATILSMEVDGVQLVTSTPASIYPPGTVFEIREVSLSLSLSLSLSTHTHTHSIANTAQARCQRAPKHKF
jgi:hypothetical protein